jgi:hypothetical protein
VLKKRIAKLEGCTSAVSRHVFLVCKGTPELDHLAATAIIAGEVESARSNKELFVIELVGLVR